MSYGRESEDITPASWKTICNVAGAIVFVILMWCFYTWDTVEADEIGVKIYKPITGLGDEGVDKEELGMGVYFHLRSTTIKLYPKAPLTVQVPFDDLATNDNNLLDFNSSITLKITNATQLVAFGDDWFKNNILNQYMSMVRRIVMNESFTKIMSDSNVNRKLDDAITLGLAELIARYKLPVVAVEVSLGKAKPNAEIVTQMNLTAAEQQRQKTLEQQQISEALRVKSETTRAQADNAYRNNIGFSVTEYVELQKAQIMADACKVSKSCVVINGNAQTLVPTH